MPPPSVLVPGFELRSCSATSPYPPPGPSLIGANGATTFHPYWRGEFTTPGSRVVIVREGEKTVRKPEEPPKQAQSNSRGFAFLTLFVNSVTDSGPRDRGGRNHETHETHEREMRLRGPVASTGRRTTR